MDRCGFGASGLLPIVSFKGNGYTPKDRVQTYMLYRCAEVTANAGYDYFVIINNDDEVKEGAINLPGSYSSTTTASVYGFGNSAVGSAYTHGTYYPSRIRKTPPDPERYQVKQRIPSD
jgi:hypothetical protein